MWFKSKPKALQLPASEARLVAQLEQVRVKFEREQSCLQAILNCAKQGKFEVRAADSNIYNTYGYDPYVAMPWIIDRRNITFLKELGYIIEVKEIPVQQKFHNLGSEKPEYSTKYYTEYLIKW